MSMASRTVPQTVTVVKIADYWRVLVDRKLVATRRTKAEAEAVARTVRVY